MTPAPALPQKINSCSTPMFEIR